MIDWRGLSYHLRVTRFDSAIVWVTAISAVAISIEFCVLIGVVMSSLLTVRRAGRMLLTEFTITPDGMIRERFPDDARCDRLLIYGLEGELFFGASAALERHFERIEQRIDGRTRAVILRLKRARNADAAGMIQLKDFVERVRARDVDVILCGVRADLAQRLETTRLSERTGATIFREERVPLTSTILAIRHAYQLIGDPCASCPRRDPGDSKPPLRYVI
jgi:SulP family sulfate permease